MSIQSFISACSNHRQVNNAQARLANLRCDEQWQSAQRDMTMDGFEGFVRACGSHGQVNAANARIAAIRANPLDIPGLMPANAPIPRQGLSAENQTRAQQCEGGNAFSCTDLGYHFSKGIGAPAYPDWAASTFARACLLKNANGCSNLGANLTAGSGIKKDLARAKILFELGCDGDEFNACYGLGRYFSIGIGISQNFERAVELYERACNDGKPGGSELGCLYAAYILMDGRGESPWTGATTGIVLPNREKALRMVTAGLKLNPASADLINLRVKLMPPLRL